MELDEGSAPAKEGDKCPKPDRGDQETVVSWDTKGSAQDSLRLDAKASSGRD